MIVDKRACEGSHIRTLNLENPLGFKQPQPFLETFFGTVRWKMLKDIVCNNFRSRTALKRAAGCIGNYICAGPLIKVDINIPAADIFAGSQVQPNAVFFRKLLYKLQKTRLKVCKVIFFSKGSNMHLHFFSNIRIQ